MDQTGPLWGRGALVGMSIVCLPYTFKDPATMREITGGTPYGASCVTGAGNESRMPTQPELEMCRYQGEHMARIASQLVAGARRQSS